MVLIQYPSIRCPGLGHLTTTTTVFLLLVLGTQAGLPGQTKPIERGSQENLAQQAQGRSEAALQKSLDKRFQYQSLCDEIGEPPVTIANDGLDRLSSTVRALRVTSDAKLAEQLKRCSNGQFWISIDEMKRGDVGRLANPDSRTYSAWAEYVETLGEKQILVAFCGTDQKLVISGIDPPPTGKIYIWLPDPLEVLGPKRHAGRQLPHLKLSPAASRLARTRKTVLEN